MGKYDINQKLLEDYNDVFADIMNVFLFNGEQRVKEKDLHSTKDKSAYRHNGKIHEQERDVIKKWQSSYINLAIIGLENQMKTDAKAPLRVLSYEGAAYRGQIAEEQNPLCPVITLILYFGKTHWRKNRTLYEIVDVPEELKPFVNDYKINVMEVSFLTDEQVAMFKSDFRIVADFFVQTRKNKEYIPSKDTIKHVDALLKLMSALTGDTRYEDVQNESKGGVKNMCEVLDKFTELGKAKGKAEGKIIGMVLTHASYGRTVEEIAELLELSEEEVSRILEENQ